MAALSKTTVLKELHALKDVLPLEVRYMVDELARVQDLLVARLQLASSVLSNQTSTYLSRVSLHVAVNTEKVNVVMKRLNAISTIMLPLLAIQGIFSMNVKVPGGDVANLNWFWSLVGVFVLSTIVLFFAFKRLGWW
jgi:magnesium transporter